MTSFSTIIGVAAGAIQGYFGGWTDLLFQRFIEIWNGLPVLYLLIILASVVQPNFWWLLGLMLWSMALPALAIDARVRAVVDQPEGVWIGQQVVLQIDLLSNGLSFSGQRIHLPDVPGALVLEDRVSTVKLSERIAGENWQVLGYRYPLFPQRPGRIDIAPIAVAASSQSPAPCSRGFLREKPKISP